MHATQRSAVSLSLPLTEIPRTEIHQQHRLTSCWMDGQDRQKTSLQSNPSNQVKPDQTRPAKRTMNKIKKSCWGEIQVKTTRIYRIVACDARNRRLHPSSSAQIQVARTTKDPKSCQKHTPDTLNLPRNVVVVAGIDRSVAPITCQ